MEGTLGRIFSKSQKSGEGAEQEKNGQKKRGNAIVDRGKGGEKGE